MPSLFGLLCPDKEPATVQTCMYCYKTQEYWGWVDLCSRSCYHGLTDLLNSYEKEEVSVPDRRLVRYFTKHPDPAHSFFFDRLSQYIKEAAKPLVIYHHEEGDPLGDFMRSLESK